MATPDRRPTLMVAYEQAADIVTGIDPERLHGPTPCAGFDVSALVDHLIGSGNRVIAIAQEEEPNWDDEHVELRDAPDRLRRASKQAASAWTDERLDADFPLPWGDTFTGSTFVGVFVMELSVHAWDIAVATGQLKNLRPEIADEALRAARDVLKPELRNRSGTGEPYGAEIEPPADATVWERLAAFTGRNPRPAFG